MNRIESYIRAGYPAIAIRTAEEARAVADVMEIAKKLDRSLVTWSATDGLMTVAPTLRQIPNSNDLFSALTEAAKIQAAVVIFRDPQTWPVDRDPVLSRALRDCLQSGPSVGRCVVLIGPWFRFPPETEHLINVMDFDLPDASALRRIAGGIAESAEIKNDQITDDLIRALAGLRTADAENALSLSVVEEKRLDPKIVYREKVAAVRRSGLLEIVDPDPRGIDAVGGLANLKKWLSSRKEIFSPEARDYGIPEPKGILLVGVPGTGKSLTAKAVGTILGIPTVRLDIGSLFGSLVGQSEERTRAALDLAGAISPCVLWIDEIDKGLAGAGGSGANDSGVTRRVFGTIVNWMQERKKPVFLVATANQIDGLPPEFLRKGRFDELFAIDLPTESERAEIFKIHLSSRKRKFDCTTLKPMITATRGFTGSEIEAVIVDGLISAYPGGDDDVARCITSAIAHTVPLSQTAREQIDSIQTWARTRARPASEPETEKPAVGNVRKLK